MNSIEFTVSNAALREAVAAAAHATPLTPNMVAYSGVLILAGESGLTITGSDGDTTITATAHAAVQQTGRVLLPPKPLLTLLAKLSPALQITVSMSSEGELVVGTGSKTPYKLRPLTATFPEPTTTGGEPSRVDFEKLPAALSSVRHAVSKDIPAIQLVSTAGALILNATDSYRLASAELNGAGFGDFTGVVPAAVLEQVSRMNVTGVISDSRSKTLTFIAQSATLTTKLLATAFPAVDGVLAGRPTTAVRFETAPVLEALGRLSAVADESPVTVSIDKTSLVLSVSNVDLGSGSEETALAESSPLEVTFHVKLNYLVDALSKFDAVELNYSSSVSPLFFSATSPVTSTQVVMPVRV